MQSGGRATPPALQSRLPPRYLLAPARPLTHTHGLIALLLQAPQLLAQHLQLRLPPLLLLLLGGAGAVAPCVWRNSNPATLSRG